MRTPIVVAVSGRPQRRAGAAVGDAVQAWLLRECGGVGHALQFATREAHWLAAGPIDLGVRVGPADEMFCIGNAAGEAHPILGEGISMALQSAALLCRHLLADAQFVRTPTAAAQAVLQRRYAADWQREFTPRLRLAAAFAHAAMHRRSATLLLALVRRWPGLLTRAARWGGKVRLPGAVGSAPPPAPQLAAVAASPTR